MSYEDETTNTSSNPHINDLVEARLQDPARRGLLRGGFGAAALSFIGGTSLLAGCGGSDDAMASAAPHRRPTPAARAPARGACQCAGTDPAERARIRRRAEVAGRRVAVPAGYTASVLLRLGDPIAAGIPDYANDGTDEASTYAWRAGDHHDGMHYFGIGATGTNDATRRAPAACWCRTTRRSRRSSCTSTGRRSAARGTAAARTVPDEVLKEFYVHGVSIVEVSRAADGSWSYRKNSPFNRRVHTLTEMELSGPAAGSSYMVTKYSTDGTRTRGTVNNCASGYTPWDTYLACEENWAGYFRRIAAVDNPNRSAKEIKSLGRYGVGSGSSTGYPAGTGRELWATVTPDTPDNLYGRWNAMVLGATAADDYRNGPNTYGWNVEIDPFAPNSTPKKRTAMGRFAHEGAWIAKVEAGKPLVWYMGCDSRNEYIYKYVSNASLGSGRREPRTRGRRQVPRRRQAVRREVQRRRHRQLGRARLRRERHHGGEHASIRSPTRPMSASTPASRPTSSARRRWTVRSGARSIRSPAPCT